MALPPGLTPINQSSALPEGLTPVQKDVAQPMQPAQPKLGKQIQQRFQEGNRFIRETLESDINTLEGTIRTFGEVFETPFDIAAMSVVAGYRELPKGAQNFVAKTFNNMAATWPGQLAIAAAEEGGELLKEARRQFPQQVKTAEKGLNLLGVTGGVHAMRGAKAIGGPGILSEGGRIKIIESITPGTAKERRATIAGGEKRSITGTFHPELSHNQRKMAQLLNDDVPGFGVNKLPNSNLIAVSSRNRQMGIDLAKNLKEMKIPMKHNDTFNGVMEKLRLVAKENEVLQSTGKAISGPAFRRLNRILREHPPTADGVLAARIKLDREVLGASRKKFFALDDVSTKANMMHDEIRTALNSLVEAKVRSEAARGGPVPLSSVLDSLSKQRLLYGAERLLVEKSIPIEKTLAGRVKKTVKKFVTVPTRITN